MMKVGVQVGSGTKILGINSQRAAGRIGIQQPALWLLSTFLLLPLEDKSPWEASVHLLRAGGAWDQIMGGRCRKKC